MAQMVLQSQALHSIVEYGVIRAAACLDTCTAYSASYSIDGVVPCTLINPTPSNCILLLQARTQQVPPFGTPGNMFLPDDVSTIAANIINGTAPQDWTQDQIDQMQELAANFTALVTLPGRQILGPEQLDFLRQEVQGPQRWTAIAQTTNIAGTTLDLETAIELARYEICSIFCPHLLASCMLLQERACCPLV